MKKILLTLGSVFLLAASAQAATYSGVVTAVNPEGPTFTVGSPSGTVKMFKGGKRLHEGQHVTVSYSPQEVWPLPVSSVKVH